MSDVSNSLRIASGVNIKTLPVYELKSVILPYPILLLKSATTVHVETAWTSGEKIQPAVFIPKESDLKLAIADAMLGMAVRLIGVEIFWLRRFVLCDEPDLICSALGIAAAELLDWENDKLDPGIATERLFRLFVQNKLSAQNAELQSNVTTVLTMPIGERPRTTMPHIVAIYCADASASVSWHVCVSIHQDLEILPALIPSREQVFLARAAAMQDAAEPTITHQLGPVRWQYVERARPSVQKHKKPKSVLKAKAKKVGAAPTKANVNASAKKTKKP